MLHSYQLKAILMQTDNELRWRGRGRWRTKCCQGHLWMRLAFDSGLGRNLSRRVASKLEFFVLTPFKRHSAAKHPLINTKNTIPSIVWKLPVTSIQNVAFTMVFMMSSMLTSHAAVEMVLNPRATVKHTIHPIYDTLKHWIKMIVRWF